MKHLHSISAHESGQILTEAALSKVLMWVEMLDGRFFDYKGVMIMSLVFLDLDGTTLYKGTPSEGIIETIALLKANGHRPVIATGRVPHVLYGVDKVLGINDYIASNGQYIKYDNQVILERYIPKDVIQRFADYCDQKQLDLVVESVDGYIAHSKRTTLVDEFSEIYNIEKPLIDSTYHLNHNILACVFFSKENIDEVRRAFPELQFNRSSSIGYDVNLSGGLKAEGISWLINYLNYPLDQVYAIGDGLNDITMVQSVHTGIAMGNAHPRLKAVAKHITDDVTAQGVFKALKHYGLI